MCMSVKAIKAMATLMEEAEAAGNMEEAKRIKAHAEQQNNNRVIGIKNRLEM